MSNEWDRQSFGSCIVDGGASVIVAQVDTQG